MRDRPVLSLSKEMSHLSWVCDKTASFFRHPNNTPPFNILIFKMALLPTCPFNQNIYYLDPANSKMNWKHILFTTPPSTRNLSNLNSTGSRNFNPCSYSTGFGRLSSTNKLNYKEVVLCTAILHKRLLHS